MLDPARTLFKALQDLAQDPPVDLEASSVNDILDWGTRNWDMTSIPEKLTL
jgi:hypothetical protein